MIKIKIIKANPGMWYEKLIGKIRVAKTIRYDQHGDCFVLRNYRTLLRTIPYNDAIILDNQTNN